MSFKPYNKGNDIIGEGGTKTGSQREKVSELTVNKDGILQGYGMGRGNGFA